MTTFVNQSAVPAQLREGVLVAGAGVSGRGAITLLRQAGIACMVADDNPITVRESLRRRMSRRWTQRLPPRASMRWES